MSNGIGPIAVTVQGKQVAISGTSQAQVAQPPPPGTPPGGVVGGPVDGSKPVIEVGIGVRGSSDEGQGVVAESTSGTALTATSQQGPAIEASGGYGRSIVGGTDQVFRQHAGVYGESDQQGLFGHSTAASGTGVYGYAGEGTGFGVRGDSQTGTAVQGQSFGAGDGVHGISAGGTGVHGSGTVRAGLFDGDVQVNGSITVSGDVKLTNADCAEQFDLLTGQVAEPGTVMILADDGTIQPSYAAYDKRVVGVVSGGGAYKPAIILDQNDSSAERAAIALIGKVFCKVDADYGPIEAGDLLTTSPTLGHAMKVADPSQAFGSVIGKAMAAQEIGIGLMPVLVSLQ